MSHGQTEAKPVTFRTAQTQSWRSKQLSHKLDLNLDILIKV